MYIFAQIIFALRKDGRYFTRFHMDVSETVRHLEPTLPEVIHLIYFQGYTRQAVANELPLPLGTVKNVPAYASGFF